VATIDRTVIYERDAGLCGFCGEPVPRGRFHVDHIKPQACGGGSESENLRLAHVLCNISAGSQARVGFPTRWNEPIGILGLRVPGHIVTRMRDMAEDEERSINYIAARLLRQALDQQSRPKKP
jgi:hypothetical protein